MSTSNQPPEEKTPEEPVTFLTVIFSTFASFFGVQRNKNRLRDFEHGEPWHFVIAGILFVLIFIGIILIVVFALV